MATRAQQGAALPGWVPQLYREPLQAIARMKYMVIETFRPGCKARVYDRFREKGRMLPEGLRYLESWVEQDGDRCFQMMETDAPQLFATWTAHWQDLVAFEIVKLENEKRT